MPQIVTRSGVRSSSVKISVKIRKAMSQCISQPSMDTLRAGYSTVIERSEAALGRGDSAG